MIVEARERSGALITADFALDDGREVFAVPGEITAGLATGTNRLIRQGAAPLTAVEDVLEVFDLDEAERARRAPLGEEARRVLERLSDGASSVDELARSTSVDPARLAAALVELELAGAVCEADGVYRAVMRRG